jgi:tetratricopeptide (TPR) repeat protein
MQMPTVYDDDILNVEDGFYPDGTPTRTIVYSVVYPPVGFFPFAGTGNGDYHGFYWPIGREDRAPLVAYSSHDAYALIPEHGDLTSAGRCQLARAEDRKLTHEFVSAFDAANVPRPSINISDVVAVDDHKQLLTLDPNSPFRNCAVADQLIAENKLDDAESHYRRAIELLPEYGAAHFGLGYLLRRTRRQSGASIYLRQSLICPLAFWGGCFWADHILPGSFRRDWARKALLWLQQLKEPDDSLRDDPFMRNVQSLTLDTGVAESRDIELSMAMVDDYHGRGQFLDAVFVWITVGDRAALETTSFRERYGLTARSFGNRLSNLFRDAGIERRAQLVDNMLSVMEKPEGLYL